MTRKTIAVLVVALAIPGAALAARARSTAEAKVTYVLKGTLSAYTAASSAADGSITIHVDSANYHSRLLTGKDLTFAISAQTTVTLNGTASVIDSALGRRVGFWNPQIYKFALQGNSPFTPLDQSGTSNDNLLYTGTPGAIYNVGSGLGTPNFATLAQDFANRR